MSFRKLSKKFLQFSFSFFLSPKLAVLAKTLSLTLVKPTRMEIIWQQSFDMFLCNTNIFFPMKFIYFISLTSAFFCNRLVNVVCGVWCFQDKIKFILSIPLYTLRYMQGTIEEKHDTPVSKRQLKKCDAM